MTNTPSDAELWRLHMQLPGQHKDPIDFARAVLAKWGTPPAVAGEPVGFCHPITWRAHQSEQVQKITREAQPEYGYTQALYTTPQPTKAQAVAVPLTDAQIAEMMRDTWGCASIAPRHALEFARAVERAHGIPQKGGAAALDCHHRPPCDECAALAAQGGKA